ncbi:hypothetical protein GE061_007764 [Apolygus lucorum]|uniref:Uncharacterized protein n=1 Tax=Apolygus lucorum TaxID=248454 RepID=A0A8S9WP97_APOLU|nr:hypothetical protein GE061_007764 [Apolygus lucorum]
MHRVRLEKIDRNAQRGLLDSNNGEKKKLWPERLPEIDEDLDVEAIQQYMSRVAYLYQKTKKLLNNLKDTIHNQLSKSVDELGKHVDMAVDRKISFIRPYLRSLLRANSRSLLGNMMKRMMHRKGSHESTNGTFIDVRSDSSKRIGLANSESIW